MLRRDEIHFFDEIAYYHVPLTHCPTEEEKRMKLKCICNPGDNFDWRPYSCTSPESRIRCSCSLTSLLGTSRFFQINNMPKPNGWEELADP